MREVRGASLTAWQRAFEELAQRSSRDKWDEGDLSLRAEAELDEMAWQFIGLLGSIGVVQQRMRLAERFPPSTRVHKVSWSHYRLVARRDLDAEEAHYWLKQAETQGWDYQAFLDALREAGVLSELEPRDKKVWKCPKCGHEGEREAFA